MILFCLDSVSFICLIKLFESRLVAVFHPTFLLTQVISLILYLFAKILTKFLNPPATFFSSESLQCLLPSGLHGLLEPTSNPWLVSWSKADYRFAFWLTFLWPFNDIHPTHYIVQHLPSLLSILKVGNPLVLAVLLKSSWKDSDEDRSRIK